MTLGRCFAAAVPGPVHAVGHQLDGGGIHHMNGALETPRQFAAAMSRAGKSRVHVLQMREDLPEELLRNLCRAGLVSVRKVVAAWRRRSPQGTQRPRVQRQAVAHIVQTDGMGELRKKQAHQLTPVRKAPGQAFRSLFPHQLREQMTRDEVAHLPQHRHLAADRWSGAFFR
jgi:hypothetical protein